MPHLGVNLGQVPIKGVNSQPVIQHDGIAGEKQLFGQHYFSPLRGVHGRTRRPWQIHTAMGRPGISV
jgi:hypothetical protein